MVVEPILPAVPRDPRPPDPALTAVVQFSLDGRQVEVPDDGGSLLDALRDHLGARSAKDGCSPQGQCGCCTVLVDGAARVACVTPARRMAGRAVTTLDGLDEPVRAAWADAFCATGASQCGFCTPGIIMRLEGLRAKAPTAGDPAPVERAMQAHLCRCTGWRTISEAYALMVDGAPSPSPSASAPDTPPRDPDAAARRAELEGHSPQRVGPEVALGRGGFAADQAPIDSLVAVPDGEGGWVVAGTLAEARRQAGQVQGRRTTVEARPPLELPPGEWVRTLRTSWVEPAYLETDVSWCEPGGTPASPLANGGAFGAKLASVAPGVARELADRHGRPVRVVLSREDCVRLGPKRPPMAAGVRADGTGVVRVVRTPGIAAAIAAVAPGLTIEEVDQAGPPTSVSLRGAGWVEALVLLAGGDPDGAPTRVTAPDGGWAEASVDVDGRIRVRVDCGRPLDAVVVRSYAIGAAHMALSWVTSEALTVDEAGEVHDLTIRSFGVLRSIDMPEVDVSIEAAEGDPVNGSDAVFAAVAAAVWRHQGCPPEWPTRRPLRG
ncbi:MAG TPA: 2Fe-2S iron-sulfur cluster-binding protein [Acidimicrobiales bacterium]